MLTIFGFHVCRMINRGLVASEKFRMKIKEHHLLSLNFLKW